MDNNKSIAFVGAGYWGKNILRVLYELNAIHTVCDTNNQILEEAKDNYPDLQFTSNFNEVLNNPWIKAVAIATPAITHYELSKRAILAGKDVFVEKPLALKVADGEELVELTQKHNKILMVGHLLQYHPAVNKLKEIIDSGEIGDIRYIYSNRLNIGKIRREENVLWSFAPHDISVILMLLNEEPEHVYAFGGSYVTKGIYDTTLSVMKFANGVKGHIFVSWLHPYKEQKLIVVGDKAMTVFDDLTKEKLYLYPHKVEIKEGVPSAYKSDYKVIPTDTGEPLKLELSHFLNCIETRKNPKTDCTEGLKVLKVLDKLENSLEANSL